MNKRFILSAGIFVASWALQAGARAQTYDANAAYLANALNPATQTNSAFGPFSLGYGVNPGDFTAFGAGDYVNSFAGFANTQGFRINNNAIVPAVVVNVDASPGFSGLVPGEILGHPGGIGANAFDGPFYNGIVRFTAPGAGVYSIRGSFRSLDGGFTQNGVFFNGASVISIGDQGDFRLTLQLAGNDVVDFAIGAAGDIGGDSTGLTASLVVGAATQVVNIDFEGSRPGDAGTAGVYAGVSAAGIGTVFTGLIADSRGGDDNLTVAGAGLLNEPGQATTVGFTIGPVGGDHEPGQPFFPDSLYDDYIFNNSAGNVSPAGSPFTIGGLGDAATADIYRYGSFNTGPDFVIAGFAGTGIFGNYNGLGATAYFGVPVTGGNITGFFGVGEIGVLGGLTIVTAAPVPEPGTALLLSLGGIAMMRRHRIPPLS